MALETLVDVNEIGGFEVEHVKHEENSMPLWESSPFIVVDDTDNSVSFKIQNGPIKEKGQNGCQVLTMIQASLTIIQELNKKFPCRENAITITHLEEAIMWQEKRTKDREKRNVEGLSKE